MQKWLAVLIGWGNAEWLLSFFYAIGMFLILPWLTLGPRLWAFVLGRERPRKTSNLFGEVIGIRIFVIISVVSLALAWFSFPFFYWIFALGLVQVIGYAAVIHDFYKY